MHQTGLDMEKVIYQSDDHSLLNRFISRFRIGLPVFSEENVRIGTVLSLRREADTIVADIECVPEDFHDASRSR